jgi:hypothetical protein
MGACHARCVDANLSLADEVGAVDVPLQFFIRSFLFKPSQQPSFLVTNMAKCSIATKLAHPTQTKRWKACFQFLTREFAAARAQGAEPIVISVGLAPKRFLEKNPDLLQALSLKAGIHRITHYSPRNNARFSRFAAERKMQFDAFVERMRAPYETFIKSGDNGKFSSHWTEYERRPESDFQRLFKWKRELQESELLFIEK